MDDFRPCQERLDTIQNLRKEFPGVKTIEMTGGQNSMTNFWTWKKNGASRTIPNPLALDSLLESVEEVGHHLHQDFIMHE